MQTKIIQHPVATKQMQNQRLFSTRSQAKLAILYDQILLLHGETDYLKSIQT